jgi:NADPH:quinone reductase-like Zn-dependent oxidoreductase
MFTRSRFQTPDMLQQHQLLNRIADWIDAGELRSTLKQRLSPIDAASLRKAHAAIESGRSIGKIALEGWP